MLKKLRMYLQELSKVNVCFRALSCLLLLMDFIFLLLFSTAYVLLIFKVIVDGNGFVETLFNRGLDKDGGVINLNFPMFNRLTWLSVCPGMLVLWWHSNILEAFEEFYLVSPQSFAQRYPTEYQIHIHMYDINFDCMMCVATYFVFWAAEGNVGFAVPPGIVMTYFTTFFVQIVLSLLQIERVIMFVARKCGYTTKDENHTTTVHGEDMAKPPSGIYETMPTEAAAGAGAAAEAETGNSPVLEIAAAVDDDNDDIALELLALEAQIDTPAAGAGAAAEAETGDSPVLEIAAAVDDDNDDIALELLALEAQIDTPVIQQQPLVERRVGKTSCFGGPQDLEDRHYLAKRYKVMEQEIHQMELQKMSCVWRLVFPFLLPNRQWERPDMDLFLGMIAIIFGMRDVSDAFGLSENGESAVFWGFFFVCLSIWFGVLAFNFWWVGLSCSGPIQVNQRLGFFLDFPFIVLVGVLYFIIAPLFLLAFVTTGCVLRRRETSEGEGRRRDEASEAWTTAYRWCIVTPLTSNYIFLRNENRKGLHLPFGGRLPCCDGVLCASCYGYFIHSCQCCGCMYMRYGCLCCYFCKAHRVEQARHDICCRAHPYLDVIDANEVSECCCYHKM